MALPAPAVEPAFALRACRAGVVVEPASTEGATKGTTRSGDTGGSVPGGRLRGCSGGSRGGVFAARMRAKVPEARSTAGAAATPAEEPAPEAAAVPPPPPPPTASGETMVISLAMRLLAKTSFSARRRATSKARTASSARALAACASRTSSVDAECRKLAVRSTCASSSAAAASGASGSEVNAAAAAAADEAAEACVPALAAAVGRRCGDAAGALLSSCDPAPPLRSTNATASRERRPDEAPNGMPCIGVLPSAAAEAAEPVDPSLAVLSTCTRLPCSNRLLWELRRMQNTATAATRMAAAAAPATPPAIAAI